MCYNCGCRMPKNDMGNPDNITEEDFEKAAKAAGTDVGTAKRNTYEMLKDQLEEKGAEEKEAPGEGPED